MGMKIGTQLPRLEGATEWFGGTQAHAEQEAAGHPTLVHFWSEAVGYAKTTCRVLGNGVMKRRTRDCA